VDGRGFHFSASQDRELMGFAASPAFGGDDDDDLLVFGEKSGIYVFR
jgi:hypothetical protein